MSLGQSSVSAGSYIATREVIRGQMNDQMQAMQSSTVPSSQSDLTNFRRKMLDFAQSDGVNYAISGAGLLLAAGGGVISAAAAAGGCCSLTAGAFMAGAATGLATAAGAAAVGMVAYKVGEFLGGEATHAVMKYIFGKEPIPESGNNPICEGDDVYHKNKSATFWGILGGIVLGTAVAIALPGVGVFMGAAICGAVTGVCGGVGNALSQYGEKKGKVLQGSPNVFFESKAVARVGDLIECSDHGGPEFVAEGARTVFANGRPIARIGHSTTCDGTLVGGRQTVLETDETSAEHRLPIKSSVPLWLEELATYTGLVMDIVDLAKGFKGLADAKVAVGDPVDVARGDLIQEWHVLSFERTLPLRLNRYYYSTQKNSGHLGQNWFDEWSQCLHIDSENKEIIYFNEKGAAYHYPYHTKKVYAQNVYCKHLILFSDDLNNLYLFNRKQQRKYLFSTQSFGDESIRYLTEISDRFGNKITFNYTKDGLSEVCHSDGFSLSIQNKNHLIQSITYKSENINHHLVSFEHNDKGQLEFCHSFQYGVLHHRYNNDGYMTSWWDSDATRVEISYDELGRVISTKTESGHYEDTYKYDDKNHCTYYIDAEGGKSCYWYNKDYVVTKIQDALGNITESEWDYSQKVAYRDALGRETRYTYDEYGDINKIVHPDGRVFLYKYSGEGVLLEVKNSLGEYWEYRYGDRNELRFVVAPNKLKWEYRYNENYQVVRQQLPDGNYFGYSYNEVNQLIGVTNSKGERTRYERDLFDRITTLVRTDGSTYRYKYSEGHASPKGSLTRIDTPEGTIQRFQYNSERLLTEIIDGEGNETWFQYGAYDLLESKTLPNGETLTFHYDKLTRLTEVKNAQGDSYCYEYDKAGQLVRETDFTGRSRAYSYDAVGRLIRKTQADGHIETFAYDNEDKLLTRNTWQPVLQGNDICRYELAHQVRYAYTNKTGQLSQTINTQYLPYFAQHITEFEYDEQYRLIAEIQDGERIEVELDKYGRQTALLLPNGVESAVKISQGFNQYGELTQFQVNNHNPLNLSYDKLGRQTRKQNQNGFILAEHFSPSGLLQAQGGGWNNSLTEQQLSDYQPNQTYPIAGTQISRKWQYDKAFNLVHTQDNHWGATEYRVNKNGQVTDVLNGLRHSEHYRYDSQLNLTQKAQRETDALGQYQFEAANDASFGMKQRNGRITRFGHKTYKYDELGRLHSKTETKKGFRPVTTYYKWNSQSQLVELHSPFKGSWRYEYDSFGRRITKYQIQTDQPQPNQVINMPIRANQDYWHKINELWEKEAQSQGEKTSQNLTALSGYRYLYKQNQLVAEAPLQITSTEGNLALTQANWADAIYWLYQEDDFTPTARYEKGQLHYTVADQVGTITELLTEDGYIDYRQKLNLWGEAEIDGHRHYAANDSNPLKCNHRFVGQYYDDESELHYNRFRYYSPETGQYISHDPIGLLGGFNPYGYVFNPSGWIDPLGLAGCPKIGDELTVDSVKKGSDAPEGGGVYQFTDSGGNNYTGSTDDFKSRTGNHLDSGTLPVGDKVTYTPVEMEGRSAKGERRVRRFVEQMKHGVDANGIPLPNNAPGRRPTRPVSPEKWKKYTINGVPDFTNPYFN